MNGHELKYFFNSHGFLVKEVWGDAKVLFMVYWNSKPMLRIDKIPLDTFLKWLSVSDREAPSFSIKSLASENEMVVFFEKMYNFELNKARSVC